MSVFAFGCAVPAEEEAPPTEAEVREVNMNGDMPVGHFNTIAAERFAAAVEAGTDGTIKVSFYPAAQLFSDELAPGAIADGAVEFAQMGVGGEIQALVGETAVLTGPSYTDMDWYHRLMYDEKGGGGFSADVLEPAYEESNIKYLAGLPYSPEFGCMTIEEVTKPADYAGFKIRTSDKSYASLMEGNGASPVIMSSSDVYMAIQRGTIEGGISGATSFVARKWFEVAGYCQMLSSGPNTQTLIANLDFWNSLTAGQKDVVMKAAKATEIWDCVQAIADNDKSIAILEDNGVQVFRFEIGSPEWEELVANGAPLVDAIIVELMGQKNFDTYQKMLADTKDGTMTWQEAIEQSYP